MYCSSLANFLAFGCFVIALRDVYLNKAIHFKREKKSCWKFHNFLSRQSAQRERERKDGKRCSSLYSLPPPRNPSHSLRNRRELGNDVVSQDETFHGGGSPQSKQNNKSKALRHKPRCTPSSNGNRNPSHDQHSQRPPLHFQPRSLRPAEPLSLHGQRRRWHQVKVCVFLYALLSYITPT